MNQNSAAKNRRVWTLLVGLLLMTVTALSSPGRGGTEDLPTATAVLDRFYEAMGGREFIAGIESLSWTTKLGGNQYAQTTDLRGKYLIETSAITFGSDGTTAWTASNFGNKRTYRRTTAPPGPEWDRDLTVLRIEQDFRDFKTVAVETFAGQDCFALMMLPREGTAKYKAYFSKDSGLLVGMVASSPQDESMTLTVEYVDWKPIDGLTMYGRQRINQLGTDFTKEIVDLELNKMDLEKFALPEPIQAFARNPEAKDLPKARDLIRNSIASSIGPADFRDVGSVTIRTNCTWPDGAWESRSSALGAKHSLRQQTLNGKTAMTVYADGILWNDFNGKQSLLMEQMRDSYAPQTSPFPFSISGERLESETLDRITFEGTPCYKVWIGLPSDDLTVYFSTTTSLPAGAEFTLGIPNGHDVRVIETYGDWKKVDKAFLPHSISLRPADASSPAECTRTIEYGTVDQAEFAIPQQVRELLAQRGLQPFEPSSMKPKPPPATSPSR